MPKCRACGRTFNLIDWSNHHHMVPAEVRAYTEKLKKAAEERQRTRPQKTEEEVFKGFTDEDDNEPSLELRRSLRGR